MIFCCSFTILSGELTVDVALDRDHSMLASASALRKIFYSRCSAALTKRELIILRLDLVIILTSAFYLLLFHQL